MRIAFFGWNPFQLYQVESIARHFPDAEFIIERRKGIEFDRLFTEEFLASFQTPCRIVERKDIPLLDKEFQAVVCQTEFGFMETLTRAQVIGMQYSMSKERHQYGPWRAMCALNLVYGRYSYERISPFSPCVMVGNPRFDRWFEGSLDPETVTRVRAHLDPGKKTILYLPTWGDLSSIPDYGDAVASLRANYNVITKVHHKTDTHEPNKKQSLINNALETVFGASDDLLYLLSCADLVLSDYSGSIFDAIYVSRPVVLLQHSPEDLVGAEKFGLESIEYLRRDQIGAVASNPHMLPEIVAAVLDGRINYTHDNAQLREDCFARQGGCGKVAADAIREALAEKPSRPFYQLYLHDLLRQHRAEIESLKQNCVGVSPKMFASLRKEILAGVHKELKETCKEFSSDMRKEMKGTRKEFSSSMHNELKGIHKIFQDTCKTTDQKKSLFSNQKNLARNTVRLIVQCASKGIAFINQRVLSCVENIVLANPIRVRKALHKISPRKLLCALVSSNQLLLLANKYDRLETQDAAIAFSALCFAKNPSMGVTLYILLLAKYGRTAEMKQLITFTLKLPVELQARLLSRLERAHEYAKSPAMPVRQCREAVHRHLMNTLLSPVETANLGRLLEILASNRWLEDLRTTSPNLKTSVLAKTNATKHIQRAESRMRKWFFLTEVANANHRPLLSPKDFTAYFDERLDTIGQFVPERVVEFFLPPHFYSKTVTEKAVHDRICTMLRRFLQVLADKNVAIVPRHQFRLSDAVPSGYWPALSYHTTGSMPGWFHLKDGLIPGYFSLDPRGFAGWSQLADLDALPSEALHASAEAVEETWNTLQREIVEAKQSKYIQDAVIFTPPSGRYIFLPMQVIDDTVAHLSHIPNLDLLHLLASELPAKGYDLVVKRHPKCRHSEVQQVLTVLAEQPGFHLTAASIHDIIPQAAAIVTVNSGVGFEALLQGKQVILTGKADYALVAKEVTTKADLLDALDNLGQPVDVDFLKRFIHYYTNEYLFRCDDYAAIEKHIDSLTNRFRR